MASEIEQLHEFNYTTLVRIVSSLVWREHPNEAEPARET